MLKTICHHIYFRYTWEISRHVAGQQRVT